MAPDACRVRLPNGPEEDFQVSEAADVAATCETPDGFAELQLAALARFADVFSTPGFSFGHWPQPDARADGVIDIPSYRISIDGRAFLEAVRDLGWITRFEWPEWMGKPEAKALFASPAGPARASVEDLGHMLTAVVRGDRFVEGTLGEAFDRGILTAIVQRARALLNEGKA